MKKYIANFILDFIKDKKIKVSKDIVEVLKVKNPKFGDYTSNISLKISTQLKKEPLKVAEDIKKYILKNNKNVFQDITVTKPGFVNFFLLDSFINEEGLKFYKENYKPKFKDVKKQKINYEFVSANPTGDLHIGHARNAIVGDVITRVFRYVGHDVCNEYYINDAGNQINDLSKSVYFYLTKNLKINSSLDEDSIPYQGTEIIDFASKLSKENFTFKKRSETERIEELNKLSINHFLNEIKKVLLDLGIQEFDVWTSESKLLTKKKVDELLKQLKQKNVLQKKDGALWVRTKSLNDSKDRVFIKSDGTYTYMVADILNHIAKIERGFDVLIDLWGKDHHGYEDRIVAILFALGYKDKLKVDYINMVQITDGAKSIKMSKRLGTSLKIKDILKKIDRDIFKFFILSKSKEQEMEIDIKISKEKKIENPFYYCQYSYARINQVIEKYKEEVKNELNFDIKKISKEIKDLQEKKLILKMLEFEDIVVSTTKEREPSILLNYLKSLSKSFNSFYDSCRIINNDDESLTEERMKLIISLRNLYVSIFNLLGIEPIAKI